jgi:hypothetical protein
MAAKSVALLQKISGQAKLIDKCLEVFFKSVVVDGKEMSNRVSQTTNGVRYLEIIEEHNGKEPRAEKCVGCVWSVGGPDI